MESSIIKALPSWYKGIQFRSRLEARWAYYFDLLGLPWVYEPEAYSLPSGNYLPDFFISTKHRKNVFFEVKSVGWMDRGVGVNGPDSEAEKQMDYDTARHNELVQTTGTDLVRLVGPPKADAWHWINCYCQEKDFAWIDEHYERLTGLNCPNVYHGQWVQLNTYSVYKNGLFWFDWGDLDDDCSGFCSKALPTAQKAANLQFDLQGRARVWQS